MNHKNRGFTLIELMIVIAIIWYISRDCSTCLPRLHYQIPISPSEL